MQPQDNQKNTVTMDKTVMTSFAIILVTGYSWAENILYPGPVYGSTGGQVQFNTSLSPSPQFQTIIWSFGTFNVITSSLSGADVVGPPYVNRVSLNKTSGGLTLKSLKLSDSGGYTVTMTPVDGTQTLQGRTILEVFDPVTGVTITGPNITLVEDITSANLTCDGKGSIITAEWMKDGQHLSESNRIIFSADNKSVLINPVKRSDSGEYLCILSNPIRSEMARYNISVFYGPDVKILGAKILEEGSDLLLYCSVASVPPATLTWTVNDLNVGNSVLYIRESCSSTHSGIYACTASNNITGLTATAQHILTVKGTSSSVLSPGEIAGIAVGLVLAVLLAISMFFHLRKLESCTRKAPRQNQEDVKINLPRQTSIRDRVENSMKTASFKQPNPNTDDIYEEFDEPDYVN